MPGPRTSPTNTTSTSPRATPSRSWPSGSAPTSWSSGLRCRWSSVSPTRYVQPVIACFGPSKDAARIEGSKSFAKDVMTVAGVKTATSEIVDNPAQPRRGARPVRAAVRRSSVGGQGRRAGRGQGRGCHRRPRRSQGACRQPARRRPPGACSNRFSTDPRCRCSASSTARPWCRCCRRRITSASATTTPAPTPAAWVHTRPCRGCPTRWSRRSSTTS